MQLYIPTGSPGSRKGFTLIELLVVIAIIALLAAILFPVFARARENARKSSCANNLKQLAVGVAQYTQDYDESFPWAWGSAGGNTCWWQLIQPYVKSTQVFACPSNSSRTNGGNNFVSATPAPGYVDGRFPVSYGVNFPMFGNGNYGSTAAFNLADMPKPAATVMMADTGVTAQLTAPYLTTNDTNKKASWLLVDPTCYNSSTSKPCNDGGVVTTPTATGGPRNSGDTNWAGPSARHLETANVAFADGHVKAMRPDKFYYADSPLLNPRVGG